MLLVVQPILQSGLAVFEAAGECFISLFTRFGNQNMLLGERIQVVREHQVKIIGKVMVVLKVKKKPQRWQTLQPN
ncbi:hypothetical protein [Lysinibacillus boronitolerans]|uniref:hypothetical protein n=1 Tax=Lysinibacillus boronitolerans TaxID=309788 RepID=UPI0038620D2A